MLKLRGVRIRGFRGFAGDQELEFATPAIFLFGENGQGKSSTLNAIEWCLYGEECCGGSSGIRERVSWEVFNRNYGVADASVRLKLENEVGGVSVITRSLKSHPKKAKPIEQLSLVLPDGETVSGDGAKHALRRLVRASFRDFITMVYQHQEVIRALLTEEPRNRNEAIDRLLGLSAHRDLIAGIGSGKVRAVQKQVAQDCDRFDQAAKAALSTQQRNVQEKRQEAFDRGMSANDLTPEASLKRAAAVLATLRSFASAIEAAVPARPVPSDWKALRAYTSWLKSERKTLSDKIPEVQKQSILLSRQQKLLTAQSGYAEQKTKYDSARRKLTDFSKTLGDDKSLTAKLQRVESDIEKAEAAASRASARRKLVKQAVAMLEAANGEGGTTKCPLCGKDAKDLLTHLKEEFGRKAAREVEAAEEKLKALEEQKAELEKNRREYKRLKDAAEAAEEKLNGVRADVARALGKPVGLSEDPAALVKRALEDVQSGLASLQKAVRERQRTLDGAEEDLGRIDLAVDVLVLGEKKRVIEHIQETGEFKQLETVRDTLAMLNADIEDIKKAINRDSHDHAEHKIQAAGQHIDQMFRRLVDHPSIKELKLEVTATSSKNEYSLEGPDGRDVVPVLSQGDMNALALSVFLGLTKAGDEAGQFGFVMLDDPSQSLGSSTKRQLVEVLNEILAKKTVIVGTSDKELEDMLQEFIVPSKSSFRFSDWSADRGPSIEVR